MKYQYNAEMDKELWSKKLQINNKTIKVGIYSYNGTEPKLAIHRLGTNIFNGQESVKNAGRLELDEVKAIAVAMIEATEQITIILEQVKKTNADNIVSAMKVK